METELSPITFYDTMKADKIQFIPREQNKMYMYVCGLTPSGYPHVGHARTAIIFDIIRRIFERKGYEVVYVSNFTDIDDKIIAKSHEEGVTPKEIADKYSQAYLDAMKELNVKELQKWVKVTENIPEIIEMVQTLIKNGYAYESSGDVYYRVKKFKAYGKLSKRSIREMLVGARVEVGEKKEDNLDFALWKSAKPGEPSWESPWGVGRPGWHIECSAMSLKYLQNSFDIHGGAQDLIFPHHENEIAQAEAYTGIVPFSRYWIHTGWVTLNREKMSKSIGNVFGIKEAIKIVSANVLRFFFISTLYSSPLEYNTDQLMQANRAFERIVLTLKRLSALESSTSAIVERDGSVLIDYLSQLTHTFDNALFDNFNTPEAISIIMTSCKEINRNLDGGLLSRKNVKNVRDILNLWLTTLGFLDVENTRLSAINSDLEKQVDELVEKYSVILSGQKDLDNKIRSLIERRAEARKNKEFSVGDSIRIDLHALSIVLEDQKEVTNYRIVSDNIE